MPGEKNLKCPNCGKELTEDEIYCYFCELEVEKISGSTDKFFSKAKHEKKS